MKLVLDANVFISAFYWGGNPQEIIDRIIEGIDELYISNEILNEVAAVMARPKFKSSPETIKKYIRALEKIGKKVVISGNIKGISLLRDGAYSSVPIHQHRFGAGRAHVDSQQICHVRFL